MSKIKWVGIGFAVVVISGVCYSKIHGPNSHRSVDHSVPVKTKASAARKIIGPSKSSDTKMPTINIIKEEVPSAVPCGVKVAQEKPRGIRAMPECYKVVLTVPEKTIQIPNCREGLIIFNSQENLCAVESLLVVTKSGDGDYYYSLIDEKNGDVEYNYAPVEITLGGKVEPTVSMFALAFIEKEGEYAVLKCANVLASKLSANGIRTICLAPLFDGIKTLQSAKDIIKQECYLGDGSANLLIPEKIQVSQK